MRTVGLIPARLGTDTIPFQNVRDLGGMPLVNYTIRTLNKVPGIDDVVLYASDPAIRDYVKHGLRYTFLKRPPSLDGPDTGIQTIISEFLKLVEADIVVLWHITSPFLGVATISDCLERVKSGGYDTAFTATEIRKFCWFEGKPLNYSLDAPIPRTQDLEPVIVEDAHLYVFKRTFFEATGQRVSANSYIKVVDHFEAHDIKTPEDFKVAELIANTGFFKLD